jgi:hypothetical protein
MFDQKTRDRFWETVEKGRGENDCWIWKGRTLRSYGQFYCGGKERRAHRVSWMLAHGEIPKGKEIHHQCLNRRCVNHRHLELLTHAENMEDARRRGAWSGERNAMAKLTDEEVLRIPRMAKGTPVHRIARLLGVSKRSVYGILSGSSWRHLHA